MYGSSRARGCTRSILFTAAIAGARGAADALERTVILRGPLQAPPRPERTRSASSSAAAAVRFMARLRRARLAMMQARGIDECNLRTGQMRTPTMRCRVVCGRGVTMLSFSPTSALNRVDLPTLGRPTSAAKPLRNSLRSVAHACATPRGFPICCRTRSRGLLLRAPARRAAALRAPPEGPHLAAHDGRSAHAPRPRYGSSVYAATAAARLQIFLQARLGILQGRRVGGSAAMRGCKQRCNHGIRACRPPSKNSAPQSASNASARIERRRNPPLLSSPAPSCSACAEPDLRGNLRQRLAADEARAQAAQIALRGRRETHDKIAARSRRLSTASPRNSRRSLFGPRSRCGG